MACPAKFNHAAISLFHIFQSNMAAFCGESSPNRDAGRRISRLTTAAARRLPLASSVN
jgi:hypothetical protein